tara:strand:+ start:442 stop:732 length:291 start_codon:yes stop_codon:yes gene_type:complete
MTIKIIKNNKPNLILVVDNTNIKQLNLLEDKQKQYIKAKIRVQEERKLVDKLLKQYENVIISTENKIINLKKRMLNVKPRTKKVRDSRSSGSKVKD